MKKLKIIVLALFVTLSTPAYGQLITDVPTATALTNILRQAALTKIYLQQQRALMVAATVNSTVPLAVIEHLRVVIPQFDAWAATPGLPAYAKDQHNKPTYDIAIQYTAMRTALLNLGANLISTFPTLGGTGVPPTGGFLAYEQLDASGTKTTRTFNAAQLAAAVALVDLAIASIQ